jgi:tripartite-type tricarboxylate transporter receptor subunit TctC
MVTSAAGGSGDNIARITARLMSAELNVSVVVDNRPGASGIIATETVVRAAPDGHTLLQTSSNLITNAATGRMLPYDVMRDLAPIANLATAEGYLVLAHPSLNTASLKELIAAARKRTLAYGTPGAGNPIHFHSEALARRAGVRMHHVPYKGLAPAITALLAGEIQVLLAPPIATRGHIEAGRVNALAIIASRRVAPLPEVPTAEEAGFAGFYLIGGWQGVFAPAATATGIITRLHDTLRKAVASAEFKTFAANGGYVPSGAGTAEFRRQIMADLKAFQDMSKLVQEETPP